jgi:hypothetical protein
MKQKNYNNYFILMGVIAGLTALLDFIGVVIFPIGILGVSAFYIGSAFFTAFAIWFKWRALIAMYAGLLVGALISGTFTVFAFILAWGNVIAVILPLYLFNTKYFNPELKRVRDYLAYVGSVTILQSSISAAWVLTGFYIFGILPAEAAKTAAYGWIGGGFVVSLLIGIPLLKSLTPFVKKMNLLSRKK